MELAAAAVYYRFPDRPDRRLFLGDASNPFTVCHGHPGTSHGPCGDAIDFNYYTFAQNNATHYGHPHVELFDGDQLIVEIFDWQRNYWLWRCLKQAFPCAYFSISQSIFDHMYPQVDRAYGASAAREFDAMTGKDPGCDYFHCIHVHCKLGLNLDDSISLESW